MTTLAITVIILAICEGGWPVAVGFAILGLIGLLLDNRTAQDRYPGRFR